jgi:hypothetical protein
MNERIKELESQCWEPRQYGPAWFNSTKFAELIVQECARKIEDMIDSGWYADTEQLKKYFGVEEQVDDSKELHTCPYREEIHNDYESLCDCDEEQQHQCAMDI